MCEMDAAIGQRARLSVLAASFARHSRLVRVDGVIDNPRMTVSQSPQAGARHARHAGLRYGYDQDPGIRRRKRGRRFDYFDPRGHRIVNAGLIDRCRRLAVPPAWTDVWISPQANSHLQATGRDARGRKQYRYHLDWRAVRDRTKFENLGAFGASLSAIRARVLTELARDQLDRDRVIAAIVRLLDRTGLRVGNDSYLRENHTSGLTTISKKHVTLHGREIELDFPGKGGKVWRGSVLAPRVARVVAECQCIPGYRLFKYRDAARKSHAVGSAEINRWLHELTGNAELTAKDFRTWHACTLFIEAGRETPPDGKAASMNALLTQVANELGNTPTILRKSYIHPNLLDLWREGSFAAPEWQRVVPSRIPRHFSGTEALFLRWLRKRYSTNSAAALHSRRRS
jgi:DNA topoisomerase-1